MGDRNRGVAAFAQQGGIELEPDQEHVKDDADLRDYIEKRPHHRREKISFRARRQPPEQRRTEHDPRDNFAHDLRLPEVAEDRTHRARRRDHHHQRQQHVQQVAFIRTRRARAEDRAPARHRRIQRPAVCANPQIQQHTGTEHQSVSGGGARARAGNSRLPFGHRWILPERRPYAQHRVTPAGGPADFSGAVPIAICVPSPAPAGRICSNLLQKGKGCQRWTEYWRRSGFSTSWPVSRSDTCGCTSIGSATPAQG